ncbi:HAD family hydrolase [Marmoricola endophyticus]|uniref:HAD family hydrolase n=1 Tax=Marmoricola endophyticus TaxID=2040280 RepID=UPI001E551ABF|nr:HAD family phosphatase [Marmoricola endophyticus]
MTSLPAAVLFDMDGTLVDTEPYWIEAEYALIAENGGTWSDEHAMQLVGNDLLDSGRYIREHAGIDLDPAEIVEALLDRVVVRMTADVPWRPGARELLVSLRERGVPVALVTMSWTRFVAPFLAALPADTFSAVVTGDVVERGKPYPDPYLEGARRLGVDPAATIAVEDSPTGTASALAAGCPVLVVPHHVPVPEQPGMLVRDTLAGLEPDDLGALRALATAVR